MEWPQGIGFVRAVENSRPTDHHHHQIKKPIIRPQKDIINCPRCNSTNTKFCYYNNYSLSQPRYFCKTCRRYWTEGGNLRNVPVGGGSRKNKRPSSSSINSSSSKKVIMGPPNNFSPHHQNPKIHDAQQTLNIPHPPIFQEFGDLQFKNINPHNPNFSFSNFSHLPVMELLKTGNISSGGYNGNSSSVFSSSSFNNMHDFKPSLSFPVLDGLEKGYNGNFEAVHDQDHTISSRMAFPFGDHQFVQEKGQGDSNVGYWNGMISGGSW